MGIFKKASVTPIVRTVISQGIEEQEQSDAHFPVDNDRGYMKMLAGDNLNKVLSKLKAYMADIRQRRADYPEHDAQIFCDGAEEMLSAALNLINSHVENRTY
jgi:hypothetical protein